MSGGGSSITDENGYLAFCEQAAMDDALFARFRRHPECLRVVEGLKPADGAEYINFALANKPHYLDRIEEFRRNDSVGDPPTYAYTLVGRFSPCTLRYVKVARDLEGLFGPLDGLDIAEIGGGYGGQCRILSVQARFRQYTIFDLPAPLRLTARYLQAFDVGNVLYQDVAAAGPRDFDLVISNYALSEIRKDAQDIYIDKVLRRAKHGYMMYNQAHFAERFPGFSYTAEEIIERVPGACIVPQAAIPAADSGNGCCLIVW